MKRLVFAGIAVFLLVLLASFPAQVAYNWFAPPEIQLSGISGSVWNGKSAEGLASGAYLRDLSWRFRPGALLGGGIAFDASASPGSGVLETQVAAKLDGSLSLTNLRGNVPLDVVHQSFQQGGVRGDLILEFENLTIRDGIPVVAIGSVTVADFVAPVLSASRIGDFRADFQSSGDQIIGEVQDLSGVLDVEGTITLLPDRSYAFTGEVAPTAETPPSILNQLQFLGSADARGRRMFRFEGRL